MRETDEALASTVAKLRCSRFTEGSERILWKMLDAHEMIASLCLLFRQYGCSQELVYASRELYDRTRSELPRIIIDPQMLQGFPRLPEQTQCLLRLAVIVELPWKSFERKNMFWIRYYSWHWKWLFNCLI